MESDKIYEQSKDELNSVRKSLAFSSITIHMDKLDGESKRAMTEALASVCSKRIGDITAVLTGVR